MPAVTLTSTTGATLTLRAVTNASGLPVTIYGDSARTSAITLPLATSSSTTFYVAQSGSYFLTTTLLDATTNLTPSDVYVDQAVTVAPALTLAQLAQQVSTSSVRTVDQRSYVPPFYVAHRGWGDDHPEHTLFAYSTAVAKGATILEVSVQRTSDGAIVCMHDTTLDRTTTGTGNVASAMLMDLRTNITIDYGAQYVGPNCANQPVPMLREVLATVGADAVLWLEPKDASTPSINAIFALLARYPHVKVVWKCAASSGGGIPLHALIAQRHGYPVWAYLAGTETVLQIAATVAAADLIGVPVTATDTFISQAVSAAHAAGKVVAIYEVHRRSDRDHYLALGVDGFVASSQYVSATTALTTSSNWASGLRAPGEVPIDTFASLANQPAWDTANRAVIMATGKSLLLGSLCPVANVNAWSATFALRWPVLPSSTLHADFIFGQTSDSSYTHQSTSNAGGYHLVFRNTGQLQLFKHDPGTSTGTQLGGSVSTAAPVANAWMTFSVIVSSTQVTIQRTDDASSSIVVSDTSYRGGYLHLCNASADQVTHYRDVVVTS